MDPEKELKARLKLEITGRTVSDVRNSGIEPQSWLLDRSIFVKEGDVIKGIVPENPQSLRLIEFSVVMLVQNIGRGVPERVGLLLSLSVCNVGNLEFHAESLGIVVNRLLSTYRDNGKYLVVVGSINEVN